MPKKNSTIPVVRLGTPQSKKIFKKITAARSTRNDEVTARVNDICLAVKEQGDSALIEFAHRFDNISLTTKTLRIGADEIAAAASRAPAKLKAAIKASATRITAYHKQQVRTGFTIDTPEGTLSQIIRPLQRVGLYVPGGHTVYPSTVLMNAIPALVAGVPEIVAITPPRQNLDPGIAYALQLCNITEVYRTGGAQGVAALAYGTKSIKRVDKVVGPGNSYVQAAKRHLFGSIDIDSIAGPSDVMILADSSANPEWVALDMLSQAEHGSGDEFAACVTEDATLAEAIALAIRREIEVSPAHEVFARLPEHAMVIVVTACREESISVVNDFAPEHLQIMTKKPRTDLKSIKNAAAIFIGHYTPVALGDYFIGTNHVLPTGGTSRFASPLGVDSFTKRMSVAEVTPAGLDRCAPYVSVFARSEAFVHHALSVERRT